MQTPKCYLEILDKPHKQARRAGVPVLAEAATGGVL